MAASPSEKAIGKFLKSQANKYPGVEFRVLRASNGEVAILPVNPETNEAELTNPQRFVVKYLWNKLCQHDKIDPESKFVEFSQTNPFLADYNVAMSKLQGERR